MPEPVDPVDIAAVTREQVASALGALDFLRISPASGTTGQKDAAFNEVKAVLDAFTAVPSAPSDTEAGPEERRIEPLSPEQAKEFEAALEKAGLLQAEYPDQMAQRSCTCEPEAICGAHRLLIRYHDLYEALCEANRKKRAMRAERDEALAAAEAPQPRVLLRGWTCGFEPTNEDDSHVLLTIQGALAADHPEVAVGLTNGTRVAVVVEDVTDAGEEASESTCAVCDTEIPPGSGYLCQPCEDTPMPCPMGCGRTTDDVAGGPCEQCWDVAAAEATEDDDA